MRDESTRTVETASEDEPRLHAEATAAGCAVSSVTRVNVFKSFDVTSWNVPLALSAFQHVMSSSGKLASSLLPLTPPSAP